jgi:hypothetical protein
VGLLTSASHFNFKLLRKKKTVPLSVLSSEQGSLLGSGQGVVIDLGEYKKLPNTVRSDHSGVRDTSDLKVKNGGRGGGVGQGVGGGTGDRAGAGAGTGLNGNITGLNTSTEDDPPTPLRRSRSLKNMAMFSRRHSFSCIPSSSCTTLQHESDDVTPHTVCGVESRSSSHPHAHSRSHGRTNDRLNGDLSYDDDNGGSGCSGGVGCGGGRDGWRSSRSQRAVSLSRASHDTDTLHSSTTSSTSTRRRTTPLHTAPITEIPSKIGLNSSKSDNSSRQSSFTSLKMKFNMDSGKSNIEKKKRRKAKRRNRVRYCSTEFIVTV